MCDKNHPERREGALCVRNRIVWSWRSENSSDTFLCTNSAQASMPINILCRIGIFLNDTVAMVKTPSACWVDSSVPVRVASLRRREDEEWKERHRVLGCQSARGESRGWRWCVSLRRLRPETEETRSELTFRLPRPGQLLVRLEQV